MFNDASLSSADLTNVNMTGANLSGANVGGADFFMASLAKANLTNAFLGAAQQLTTANLAGVIWKNTTCPDGTNSDANGSTCIGHLWSGP